MEKTLEYYLELNYPFNVKPDLDDGGYIIEFPDLRYCVGTGNTIDEAIEDAMITKEEWIKAAYEHNVTIPEPLSNEEFNGRVTLRLPRTLHRSIIETAKREGISANQFLLHLISLGMGTKPVGIKARKIRRSTIGSRGTTSSKK
ncbi:MAG: type II toxin-antitoxin system HicB family antitoxin [Eubacteriales bacterium]|jgi:antitoxin HicB|nr:type II toxin-antitoxin system HicB family antitoxin [Eubacteriales bacterium]